MKSEFRARLNRPESGRAYGLLAGRGVRRSYLEIIAKSLEARIFGRPGDTRGEPRRLFKQPGPHLIRRVCDNADGQRYQERDGEAGRQPLTPTSSRRSRGPQFLFLLQPDFFQEKRLSSNVFFPGRGVRPNLIFLKPVSTEIISSRGICSKAIFLSVL